MGRVGDLEVRRCWEVLWQGLDGGKALLRAGATLVADRYSYSGVAFSAAKGLDLNWCKVSVQMPAPIALLYSILLQMWLSMS